MMTSNNILRGEYDPTMEPDKRGLGPLLFDKMKSHGNKIAQIDAETGKQQTYAEMLEKVIRVAQNMQVRGITQKDMITLCTPNTFDSYIPYLASIFIQTTVSSLDPTISLDETAYLLNTVKPTILFIGTESIDLIEAALKIAGLKSQIVVFGDTDKYIPFSTFLKETGNEENFEPKPVMDLLDTAVIFFSSGSTGLPKGVKGTHYGLIATQLLYKKGHDNSIMLYYTSLYWVSGAASLLMSIFDGGARLVCRKYDPKTILPLLEKYKVTYLFLSPYLVTQMIKFTERNAKYDTSSLKSMVVGGGKIIKEHLETLKELLPRTVLCHNYGMTETHGIAVALNPVDDVDLIKSKPSCVGTPAPGYIYKVVDVDTETAVGPNKEGELRIKSKTITTGYYNNEKETVEAFDNEGFFRTGDIVYYDEYYCFFIVDRIKEAMKYQAWQVIPAEIEGVLLQHPCVKEAAVFGKPDPVDGDHPMAAVVLHTGSNIKEEEIVNFVNNRVPERKKLRAGVKIVDKLFYTPTGKIQRRKLRDTLIK